MKQQPWFAVSPRTFNLATVTTRNNQSNAIVKNYMIAIGAK